MSLSKHFITFSTFPIDEINENFIDKIYEIAMFDLERKKAKLSESCSVAATTLTTENLSDETIQNLKDDIENINDVIKNMNVNVVYILADSKEIIDKIIEYSKNKVEILQTPQKGNLEYRYTVTYKSIEFTIHSSCVRNVKDLFISVYISNGENYLNW